MTDLEAFVIWAGEHGHYTILPLYNNFVTYKAAAAKLEADAKYQNAVPDEDVREL